MRDQTPSRRHILLGVTAGLSVLAGCTTADDAPDDGPGSDEEDTNDTDGSGDTNSQESELDLREANVVDVSFEQAGRTYTFDVALHHDDGGEDGFANWWQVERLDGTQLGRRELRHAHSQQPFTRSESIDIPDDVSCAVVRGHDQTHGYGGQAAVVTLEASEMTLIDQGQGTKSFTAADCS